MARGAGAEVAGERQELAGVEILLAKLDRREPGAEAGLDDLREGPPPGCPTIGDQAEPEAYGSGAQSGIPSSGLVAVA